MISSPIKITLSLIFYVFIIIVLVYYYKLNKKDNDNFLEISNLIKNNEFFKALLSLKDHNIDDAILYKDKLIKSNKKLKGKKKDQFKDQIINIEKIILAVNKGIKIDIKSQFPIVDEIINNIKQKMN